MYASSMILSTTLAIAASAFAPTAPTSGTGSDAPCWKAGTTVNVERCFVESGKRSDADLNLTYAKIMSVLDAGDRQHLQKAETFWITYRNAACEAEYRLWNGGSGGPPAKMACIDGETRRHLDYLRTTYRLRLQRLAK
jgi:uncharacterized protein YecT (DUF1311 family)